jgi:hypothetical protein
MCILQIISTFLFSFRDVFFHFVLQLPSKETERVTLGFNHKLLEAVVSHTQKYHYEVTDEKCIYLWLYSPSLGLGSFFIFLNFYAVSITPWTGDQPVARPLPAHRTAQTQNKRTQTSMPQFVFEPTIPVFERAKAVHALDRTATVISMRNVWGAKLKYAKKKTSL